MTTVLDRAIILAAGTGSRLRRADTEAALSDAQRRIADRGVKALVPIGRPFLDFVLHELAETGFREICMVVGPEHHALRERYQAGTRRLHIDFAVQAKPRGTADAVRAAYDWAGTKPFAVLNSDNLYPAAAIRRLRALAGPGLVAFTRSGLLQPEGNLDAKRLAAFAILETDQRGRLKRIVEKPDAATYQSLPEPVLVSMGLWRFDTRIFAACAAVAPSSRGELELPSAVQGAIDRGDFAVETTTVEAAVLDLSARRDIATLTQRLAGREIDP